LPPPNLLVCYCMLKVIVCSSFRTWATYFGFQNLKFIFTEKFWSLNLFVFFILIFLVILQQIQNQTLYLKLETGSHSYGTIKKTCHFAAVLVPFNGGFEPPQYVSRHFLKLPPNRFPQITCGSFYEPLVSLFETAAV
jgi:hypothetical protein